MRMRSRRCIQVALAVIERRGRVLICLRRRNDVLGGRWEFPGGKRVPGETWRSCLRRELREELGIAVGALKPFVQMRHRYGRTMVTFQVFRCALKRGRPRPLQAERLRWVIASRLPAFRFPPANRPLIRQLAAERGAAQPRS